MQTIKLKSVRYNAQIGAFEARVDVERGDRTYRYPCRLALPMDAEIDAVKLGLMRQALRMSDTTAPKSDRPRFLI